MSAFRSIFFCCAGSSKPVVQTRDLDDGADSPLPTDKSQPTTEVEEKASATDRGPQLGIPQADASPENPGLGHHVSITAAPHNPNTSARPKPSVPYIDTQPPPPEAMRTPTNLQSPRSDTGPLSPKSMSETASISGGTLQPPPSPLPKRSLELSHERMVSTDWADTLLSSVSPKEETKVSLPTPVREEVEPVSTKEKTDKPSVEEPKNASKEGADDVRKYTRESVIVVDEKLTEFAWAASTRMSVITDNRQSVESIPAANDKSSVTASGRLSPAPSRSPSPLPALIEAEFNPSRDPRRQSVLSTYSAVVAPAAAAAAIARHEAPYTPVSRPESPSGRFSQLSAHSFALNPSYSRPQSPAKFASNRFSGQSSHYQRPQSVNRPFSSLSITESAYSTSTSGESSRTATPEPPHMPIIAGADHPLLTEHLAPLQTILLPALDGLLANTSILSNYPLWERAMSLRRETRAFLGTGADECLIVVEGEVVGVKDDKVKRMVKGFIERGDAIRKAASGMGLGAKTEGMERVRSFWVDRQA